MIIAVDNDERMETLRKEIRTRLGPLCEHMDEADFEELVTKVAVNHLKPTGNAWPSRAALRDQT